MANAGAVAPARAGGAAAAGGRDPGPAGPACWFCSKGRHAECMGEMPVDGRSDGPHDCSFDAVPVACGCCGGGSGGSGGPAR